MSPPDISRLKIVEGYNETKPRLVAAQEQDMERGQFTKKIYASPGGAATTTTAETSHCSKIPAKGALKGLLLAKKDENGRTPSRPSS